MDAHKALNALQRKIASETLEGASVYGIQAGKNLARYNSMNANLTRELADPTTAGIGRSFLSGICANRLVRRRNHSPGRFAWERFLRPRRFRCVVRDPAERVIPGGSLTRVGTSRSGCSGSRAGELDAALSAAVRLRPPLTQIKRHAAE